MILNGSGNYRDAETRKPLQPDRLEGPGEDTKRHQGASIENNRETSPCDLPNPVVSTRDIGQLDIENDLNVINQSSSLQVGMENGLPTDGAIMTSTTTFPNKSRNENSETQNLEVEGYIPHIRKLIKNLGIYTLSSLASPLATLILAPFLTRNLSTVDYGALTVLNTTVTLLTGLTQLGLSTAFFRFYNYESESQSDRLGVLSTTVSLLSLMSIFTALAILITAPWLSMLIFNNSSFTNSVRLMGVVVLVQNLTVPGFAWLRAESRAGFFSALSIANLLVCIAANFTLLGVLHMGISGSLIATGSGYAVVLICTLPIILLRSGVQLRIGTARGMISFGLPSVFTFLSVWVLFFSDRFLLARLGSLAQAASYAVAYSLGGVLSTIILNPVTLAWPPAMFSIAKRDDAANIFRLVFRWYGIVLLFATFGLSLVSTIALELFFPPAYQASVFIIPIIASSYMLYGVYIIFMTGTYIRRKTWYAVVFTTTAALTNVGLNIILIPLYGSMGAAVSTLLAYVVFALLGYVVNQRIYPIPYEIGLFIIELLIGIALYVGSDFLARNDGRYEAWGIYIGAQILYGGSLAFLGLLSMRNQRNKACNRKNQKR